MVTKFKRKGYKTVIHRHTFSEVMEYKRYVLNKGKGNICPKVQWCLAQRKRNKTGQSAEENIKCCRFVVDWLRLSWNWPHEFLEIEH